MQTLPRKMAMQRARTIRRVMVSCGFVSCGLAAALCVQTAQAETTRSVTVSNLFAESDQVMLLRIVAGDTEHYDSAVYKAVVETAYKGAKTGDVVYFGPYAGLGIGAEYVVFLQAGSAAKSKMAGGLSFGDLPMVGKIMSAGYAALPVGYECVFDESSSDRRCDDSVELNPEQIILPKTMRTFPRRETGVITSYKIWVRRSEFLPLMQRLSGRAVGSGAATGR